MIAVGIVIGVLILAIAFYAYKNMHQDDLAMKKVWKAGFEEKQVTLPNGTVLNYGEGGSSNSIPLFLIHGQGQAWQDYDMVLPKLAEKFHVYAVDCHGHGKSSHNPDRYNCKLMTEDFIWFIENVVHKPCILSGHSSGGILATSIAALSPTCARALVIEDAPFFCVEPDEMQQKNAFVWVDSFKPIHDFMNQSETDSWVSYYFNNGYVWQLFGELKGKLANSAVKSQKKHPDAPLRIWYVPQTMLRGLYYNKDFDNAFAMSFYNGYWFDGTSQEEILKSVSCPCTYLKAKTGYIIDGKPQTDFEGKDISDAVLSCANTEEDSERVMSLIPGCKKVVTPTSDHLIHCKYPDVFIEAIEAISNKAD